MRLEFSILLGFRVFLGEIEAFVPSDPSLGLIRRHVSLTRVWGTTASKEYLVTHSALKNEDARDDVEVIERLTETAIFNRGEIAALESIEQLNTLSQQRRAYNFGSYSPLTKTDDCLGNGRVISHLPNLIPDNVTNAIFLQAKEMEREGWLSTNPDSVDGLPSFHLNLISDGKPLFSVKEEGLGGFEKGIIALVDLVEPFINGRLLPKAKELLNTTDIAVGDVFLRRYGEDVLDGKSRNGISAHYDVFSKATSVIALDNTAADGRNGLYTTVMSDNGETAKTSNHAALRRFFPLARGDAVLHTWDILHGVDVEPGLDRTSLIIWFTGASEGKNSKENNISPWLTKRSDLDNNDVAQFVLASALESASSTAKDQFICDGNAASEFALYLDSAARGNTFALTRLGSLFYDHGAELTAEQHVSAADVLDNSLKRPTSCVPEALLVFEPKIGDLDSVMQSSASLAKRLWLEGAIRGNPIAQLSLADEIMFEISNANDDPYDLEDDARLIAATLFALAAQQFLYGSNDPGHSSVESLARVVQSEVVSKGIETEDDFARSPVVQIASMVMHAYQQ